MAQSLWSKRRVARTLAVWGLAALCGLVQPALAHHRGGGGGGGGRAQAGGGGGGGQCGGGGGGGTATGGTTTGTTTGGTTAAVNSGTANLAAFQAANAYNPNALGQSVMQQVRLQQAANQQRALARRAQSIQQTHFVASVRAQMARSGDPEAMSTAFDGGSVRPWLLQQRRQQVEAVQNRRREAQELLARHGDR